MHHYSAKPFDDHHNHHEDHENTRNVVFIALQEDQSAYTQRRRTVLVFLLNAYDANESKPTKLAPKRIFVRYIYRQSMINTRNLTDTSIASILRTRETTTQKS